MKFPTKVQTTPVHFLTSAPWAWQKRRLYGYCAGADGLLQRLPKKNPVKREAAPRTQVYARRARRGWTSPRTTSYPCPHCRRLRETIVPQMECCFSSDDQLCFFFCEVFRLNVCLPTSLVSTAPCCCRRCCCRRRCWISHNLAREMTISGDGDDALPW